MKSNPEYGGWLSPPKQTHGLQIDGLINFGKGQILKPTGILKLTFRFYTQALGSLQAQGSLLVYGQILRRSGILELMSLLIPRIL